MDEKWTGIYDAENAKINLGDTVSLFGMTGKVIWECGAYGIGFDQTIDWSSLEKELPKLNTPLFCYNDNFVSFYELMWNYDCQDDICHVVTIVHN